MIPAGGENYPCSKPAPCDGEKMKLLLMKNSQHGSMAYTHVIGNAMAAGGWCLPNTIKNVLKASSLDSSSASGVRLFYLQGSCLSKSMTDGNKCGMFCGKCLLQCCP